MPAKNRSASPLPQKSAKKQKRADSASSGASGEALDSKVKASDVSKGSTGDKAQGKLPVQMNAEGDKYLMLSDTRRVSVRQFKGKTFVDIREFYTDKAGALMPGKKGISLSPEQWRALAQNAAQIDELVAGLEK